MQTVEIEIEKLHQSRTNQRVDIADQSIKELMASIQSVGVLNPIIVRKNADGFEIIAGHRRFAALRRLNSKMAPVQIVEANDEEALKIQITENLQRVDLNPIEEAKSFDILADHYKLDVKSIAERADKSVAYVTRAMALLTLTPKTQAMIADKSLTAAHGHQIARVDGKQRETIEKYATTKSDWSKRYPTILELQNEIEKKVEKDLSRAVFPKDVPQYGATTTPACVACPFNTGNQNVLFDGAEKGSCTNGACFNKRTNFAYNEMRDKVQSESPKLKFIGFSSAPGYMGYKEIKGYPIIDAGSKRMKDVRATPEKFGFSIQKPSKYDNAKKKAAVVIVSLNKKEKPERQEPQRDWEKERFIEGRVNETLLELADKKIKVVDKKHLIQMLRDQVEEPGKLASMNFQGLVKRLYLIWLSDGNIESRLKAIGIEAAALKKETIEKANELYATKKEESK